MGTKRTHTSSGSKSRDTRGSEPSQDDVREELQQNADDETGSDRDIGGTGVRGQRANPGRDQHH